MRIDILDFCNNEPMFLHAQVYFNSMENKTCLNQNFDECIRRNKNKTLKAISSYYFKIIGVVH